MNSIITASNGHSEFSLSLEEFVDKWMVPNYVASFEHLQRYVNSIFAINPEWSGIYLIIWVWE